MVTVAESRHLFFKQTVRIGVRGINHNPPLTNHIEATHVVLEKNGDGRP